MSLGDLIKVYLDMAKAVGRKYEEYAKQVKELNNMWAEYRNAVNKVKRGWDADVVVLASRIRQLKAGIDAVKEELDILRIKRELGVIDEEEYTKLSSELNDALSKLVSAYEEARARIEEVDRGIKEHWLRSMDVASVSPDQVDEMLKELEAAKERNEVSQEVYERVKADLELVKRLVSALRITSSK